MPKMRTFLPAMCPAFFIRVRPASRKAKPACMNITRTAVMTTQIVLAATRRSLLDTSLHLLQAHPGAVVQNVGGLRRPADPVHRLVAAAGRVADRRLHLLRNLVLD